MTFDLDCFGKRFAQEAVRAAYAQRPAARAAHERLCDAYLARDAGTVAEIEW